MCVVFFHLGLSTIFARPSHLLRDIFVFHLVTHTHSPIYTHPPTFQGFSADAHCFTLTCWWVVGGVSWTTFRDSPCENDFILVTQVRAIILCLFDFVRNQVWELHTSTATSPLLFSVASMTDVVGHSTFTSFVNGHTSTNFYKTSMATEQVGLQFSQYTYIMYILFALRMYTYLYMYTT